MSALQLILLDLDLYLGLQDSWKSCSAAKHKGDQGRAQEKGFAFWQTCPSPLFAQVVSLPCLVSLPLSPHSTVKRVKTMRRKQIVWYPTRQSPVKHECTFTILPHRRVTVFCDMILRPVGNRYLLIPVSFTRVCCLVLKQPQLLPKGQG